MAGRGEASNEGGGRKSGRGERDTGWESSAVDRGGAGVGSQRGGRRRAGWSDEVGERSGSRDELGRVRIGWGVSSDF